MRKAYQSFIIFLTVVFHLSYALGNELNSEIDPCDLMFHGRDILGDQHPEISTSPLSRRGLPIEFHLNHSIPEQHRPVIYEAALEWNRKVEFGLITISDEVDDSQWNTPQQNPSFRNVIYWLNEDQYNAEDIIARNGTLRFGGETFFRLTFPPSPSPIPYVFILDTDIVIYEESNNIMNLIRWMFTLHLKGIGIEPPKDMDAVGLQHLFIERLSEMSSDDFYDMVIVLMEDKHVTLPSGEPKDIQKWIIEEINAEMEDIQPLTSFEDLRNLMIKEYSLDIRNIPDNNPAVLKGRLLHEFGHALGLSHNNERGSLMYDGLNITPVPYFPKNYLVPRHIDDLALHGLSCSPFSEAF